MAFVFPLPPEHQEHSSHLETHQERGLARERKGHGGDYGRQRLRRQHWVQQVLNATWPDDVWQTGGRVYNNGGCDVAGWHMALWHKADVRTRAVNDVALWLKADCTMAQWQSGTMAQGGWHYGPMPQGGWHHGARRMADGTTTHGTTQSMTCDGSEMRPCDLQGEIRTNRRGRL